MSPVMHTARAMKLEDVGPVSSGAFMEATGEALTAMTEHLLSKGAQMISHAIVVANGEVYVSVLGVKFE